MQDRAAHGLELSPTHPALAENGVEHLRVLIANERRDRLELLAQVVAGLGHEVIAREVDVSEVGAVTAREHPDVALVGLGLSSEHARARLPWHAGVDPALEEIDLLSLPGSIAGHRAIAETFADLGSVLLDLVVGLEIEGELH